MQDLKENYNKAVMAYIKEFEGIAEMDFDGWVGDIVGEVALFGDYFIDFSDIKTVADTEMHAQVFFEWYDFVMQFREKAFVKLSAYHKRRSDAMYKLGFAFDKDDFQKGLIYERIKK